MNIEILEKQVKSIMEKDGRHVPMIILQHRNGDCAICPIFFDTYEEKKLILKKIREIVQENKVPKYWVIMEAWFSDNVHILPSKDVNKKEAICISEYSSDMKRKTIFIPFTRNNGNIIWEKKQEITKGNEGEYYSTWDFYKEDVMDEIIEKHRREDLLKQIDESDITEILEDFKKDYKEKTDKDIGNDFTEENIKATLRKMVIEGRLVSNGTPLSKKKKKHNI